MTRKEIIESTKVQGGMYAVIPSVVMLDDQLSVSARMLYGVIVWACNQNACTWASNRALGAYMGLSPKRISELIAQLEKQGHIETEVVRDTRTNQVERRYIYPVVKSSKGMLPREDTPIPKNQDTSPETSVYPPPKNQEVKEPTIRLTIRLTEELDKLLRTEAVRRGTNLNQMMLYILNRGTQESNLISPRSFS